MNEQEIPIMEQMQEQIARIQSDLSASATQNSAQNAQIMAQIIGLAEQYKSLNFTLTTLTQAVADMPEKYIPRREHDAANLPTRIKLLEEFRMDILTEVHQTKAEIQALIATSAREAVQAQLEQTREDSAKDHTFMQWLTSQAFSIITFLIMLSFTIYNMLHH